jgi:hypothetical protein
MEKAFSPIAVSKPATLRQEFLTKHEFEPDSQSHTDSDNAEFGIP